MEQSNQYQRGTLKIIWEGLKLAYNNFALLYPILLLSFLTSSLFFLLAYLYHTPLVLDLTKKLSALIGGNTDSESPEFSLLLTAVGLIEVVALIIISFIVKSLVATATLHVLSTAYSSNTPSSELKEVVFASLNWSLIKRSMITQLYSAFSKVALTSSVLLSYYSSSYHSHSYVLRFMAIFSVVCPASYYLCFFMLLDTSVVVSVVEEGSCYGWEAITKVSKLIRGRGKQAILIALVESVVRGGVLYAGYNLVMAPASAPVNMAWLALGFGQVALGVVVTVLIWSVLTVFYYECSAGLVEGMATKGGMEYSPVPTQVNEALL